MTTARQPHPPSTWRLTEHCTNPRCKWWNVRYVNHEPSTYHTYHEAWNYVIQHPHGPDRETT